MKNRIVLLTGLIMFYAVPVFADDGHLRALGLARLASFLLPVLGILLLVFIMAGIDRFTTFNRTSSIVLKVISWMLVFVLGFILMMIDTQEFLIYWVGGVLLVVLLVLYLDFKFKLQTETDETQ